MDIKHISATLALLGTASFSVPCKRVATTTDNKTTPRTCDSCGQVIAVDEQYATPRKPDGTHGTVHARCMR